jgi:hypothetical protein
MLLKQKFTVLNNLALVIILAFIIGIAGCGKKDDISTKTGDTKVEKNKEGTDVKTGDVEVSDNKLPSDWPSDIPQFKDSKILASAKTPQGTAVTFEIKDKPKAVSDFYKSEMNKSGYTSDKNMEMMLTDKGGIMIYKKGGKEVSFTYGYDDATSKTSLVVLIK